MSNPIVQLKHVTKQIGKKTIIDQLSFDVYPGEIFGFLGPNGAGKTTTIRMMVGLMSITEGDIFIKGISVKDRYKEAIAHVGGIVENPEMYKFMSGYKNLLHYARMVDGVSKKRVDEIVQLVGLEKRIHEKVKSYSLGMRQRVGLAQAMLHSPSVLILDEPTNGLDPAGIRELRQYLRKLTQEGVSVIVSSHLLAEMELMCDRFAIIQNGKLKAIQSVHDEPQQQQEKVVIIKAEPVEAAATCLAQHFPLMRIVQKEQDLQAEVAHEEIPHLVAALVQEGIKVYQIQAVTKSLEDKFLEVTGGNQIE